MISCFDSNFDSELKPRSKHTISRAHSTVTKMTSTYSDIHRQFLQVVMSRGCISRDSANKVLVDIFASRKCSY